MIFPHFEFRLIGHKNVKSEKLRVKSWLAPDIVNVILTTTLM